jgi:hypothetical protein
MHLEIFYMPAAILTFFASMNGGLRAIIGMFYIQLGACVIWTIVLASQFGIMWELFTWFSPEIFYVIAGVVVTTRLSKKTTVA